MDFSVLLWRKSERVLDQEIWTVQYRLGSGFALYAPDADMTSSIVSSVNLSLLSQRGSKEQPIGDNPIKNKVAIK